MTEDIENVLELDRHHKTFEHIEAAVRELSPEIAVVAIAHLVRTDPPIDHIWVRQQAKEWLKTRV